MLLAYPLACFYPNTMKVFKAALHVPTMIPEPPIACLEALSFTLRPERTGFAVAATATAIPWLLQLRL